MTTTPTPATASKRCSACRELPAKCRCQRLTEAHSDPVVPAARPKPAGRKAKAHRPAGLVDGAALATAQAGDAGSIGALPAAVVALVLDHAGRAGLAPAEWVARAVRAYAKVPATSAERMRASRARKAAAKTTKGGTE